MGVRRLLQDEIALHEAALADTAARLVQRERQARNDAEHAAAARAEQERVSEVSSLTLYFRGQGFCGVTRGGDRLGGGHHSE